MNISEQTCNERHDNIDKWREKVDKVVFGNGHDGLVTAVSKNTDHRLEMQGYMRAINRKMYGILVVGVGIILALLKDLIAR